MKQVTFLHFKCTVLLCVILIFSTGCTRQDWLDLVDIGRAWAQANNILDENGSPTGSTLTRVVSSRIGIGEPISTGNETNDALIDAGLVIKDFNKAEKLSEESFNEHDISKIDEAIKIRPQDYSYRNQRGALLFFDDDPSAQAEFDKADELAQSMGRNAYIRSLQSRRVALNNEFEHFKFLHDERIISEKRYKDLSQRYKTKFREITEDLYQLTNKPEYNIEY